MTKNLSDAVKRRTQGPRAAGSQVDGILGQMMGTGVAPVDIARPIPDLLLREIDITRITLDPTQPRKTYSETALEELAQSVAEEGLIQAIGVFWSETEQTYVVFYGERRFRAAQRAGLARIPAVIWPTRPDDVELAFKRIVENEQREPIPAIEAAQAIQELMDRARLSQREVARKLGKSPMYVNELLAILKLPPPLLARSRGLPKRALVEIARAKDPAEQERLLRSALSSESPHTAVKEARERERADHSPRTVRRYKVSGRPVTITVQIAQAPETVTDDEVIEALELLILTLKAKRQGPENGDAAEA